MNISAAIFIAIISFSQYAFAQSSSATDDFKPAATNQPGKKYHARSPKSSELNERSSVVVKSESGTEILVRQVAGAVARRIVTYSEKGEKVSQGDELGFIKFGSRVDIFLPVDTEVDVQMFEQVRASRTILAKVI